MRVKYKSDKNDTTAYDCSKVYESYKDNNTAMDKNTRETNAMIEKELCYKQIVQDLS